MASKSARSAEIADDALREAFARLPDHQDLFRCAATCRRWRRLVTDRDFLRRAGLWPDTARRPCVLAGIFSQKFYPGGSPRSKKGAEPQFLSLQASRTQLAFDAFGAFSDPDLEIFGCARPLAARRGFLLMRMLPPDDTQRLHLAVCRPLVVNKRTTCLLPPPPFNVDGYYGTELVGCTIITDDDSSSNPEQKKKQQRAAAMTTTMFQVLLIYKGGDGFLCACTYSSDAGTWNAPIESDRAFRLTSCGTRAGVVTRGTAHWLFRNEANRIYYTLNVSLATSHVSFTEIPIKVKKNMSGSPIPCIAGEQRRLSFVTIRDNGVAEIWTNDEHDDNVVDHVKAVWRCSELADFGKMTIDLVFFAESRGALLVEQGGGFYIVDLKSKEKTSLHLMKKRRRYHRGTRRFPALCTSTYCCGVACNHNTPVLYEMDWVFNSVKRKRPHKSCSG